MDRNQRSRSQKSGGSVQRPPKRGMESRLGLTREPPRQARSPAPDPTQRRAQPPARSASTQKGRGGRTSTANPQKPGYRSDAPQNRRITQAEVLRRRRRRALISVLMVGAVLVVGVVLSVNLLFKVGDFQIRNWDGSQPAATGPYTEQQILDVMGVGAGDALFGFSTAEKSKTLESQLPYLDEVQVEVRMPSTVIVRVRPAVERFAVPYGAGWLVVSESLKILRTDAAQPDGLCQLEAPIPSDLNTTPGGHLTLNTGTAQATAETAAAGTAQNTLTALLQELQASGLLQDVTYLALTDPTEINFLYQGRVSVKLGTANNLAYKMRLAAAAITDPDKGLSSTDRGTLDVSYQFENGEVRAYFEPADPTQDAGQSEEPEQPPAEESTEAQQQ